MKHTGDDGTLLLPAALVGLLADPLAGLRGLALLGPGLGVLGLADADVRLVLLRACLLILFLDES